MKNQIRNDRIKEKNKGRGYLVQEQNISYQITQRKNIDDEQQYHLQRMKREKRRRELIREEFKNLGQEEKEGIEHFTIWLDGLTQNMHPFEVYNYLQNLNDFPSILEKITITQNQFEQVSILIYKLTKKHNHQNFIFYLSNILESSWFNYLLLERCTLLIDQALQIKYLQQEMQKIFNLIYPTLNFVPNSLKNSLISSIFHMQAIIEIYFPQFYFKEIFNQYDKFLLQIYKTTKEIEYKETPIHPVTIEFNNFYSEDQQLFGKIVKLDQGQQSLESYLNFHFNILREDYIRDLRRALSSLNKTGFFQIDKEIVDRLNLFQNIELNSVGMNNSEVIWGISIEQFDLDGRKQKNIDWSRSKKLAEGTLICLTNIECFPLIFGIITYRPEKQNQYNTKNNQPKKIFLEFKFIDPRQLILPFLNLLSQKTVLIQHEELVQPVMYYLESLKQKEEFPFEDIIVRNQNYLNAPDYINANSNYINYIIDFSGIQSQQQGYKINIFQNSWPSIPSSLDQSQLNAIKVMLKNEIALVQGPPGTGKTYCGALAVRTLFYNLKQKDFPIMIVCYTNHALDQFLEHIIKFVPKEDVARIGNSCKIQALQECIFKCKTQSFQFEWDKFKIIKSELQKILERMLGYNYKPNSNLLKKHWPQLYDKIVSDFMNDNDLGYDDFSDDDLNYFVDCWLQIEKPEEKVVNYNEYFNGMSRYFKNKEITQDFEIRQMFSTQLTPGQLQQQNSSDEEIDDYLDSEDEALFKGNYRQTFENDQLKIQEAIKNFNNNFQNLNKLHHNIKGIEIIQGEIIRNGSNPWHLNKNDISEVKYFIRSLAYQSDCLKYDDKFQQFQQLSKQLKQIYDDNEIQLLNEKKIIGVTATGIAKQIDKLQQLNTKIMVIEEAAEVLESHVASILTKNIQHLILIGDHKQLRPQLKCYDLGKKFQANISLFERLVKNQIPVAVLKQQRRMKTKFADFIRQIYGNTYEDHQDIQKLNAIKIIGLETDLVFFNHKWMEAQDEKSKINYQEAAMIFNMVQYLLKISYKEEQISVLALYLKQAQYLKRKFINQKQFKVKVQTVDNFQGEENDIVILSLVRNNNQNRLGYVAIENRINVALSRAKIGLYIFGNFDFIRKASGQGSIWEKMINLAKQKQCLQDYISVKCDPHGNLTRIQKPEEWEKVKPGLCNQKCKITFANCQHQCEKQCHKEDHSANKCPYKCDRIIDCGHKCAQMCRDKCVCTENVSIDLNCGHTIKAQCGTDPYSYICNIECSIRFDKCGHDQFYICYEKQKYIKQCFKTCERIKQCGHKCNKQCWEYCYPCKDLCSIQFQKCGHKSVCRRLCYEPCDPCLEKVEKTLECGHKYQVQCAFQDQEIQSIVCKQQCIRIRKCGHDFQCTNACNETCSICQAGIILKLKCGHKMQMKCFQRNQKITCNLNCIKPRKCQHNFPCSNKCYEQCSPCFQKVDYLLECGHLGKFSCDSIQNNKQETLNSFKCTVVCKVQFDQCGHEQTFQCYDKYRNFCFNPCDKIKKCGHKCFKQCWENCNPCLERCEILEPLPCGHKSNCSKLCNEQCDPCMGMVDTLLECGHVTQLECSLQKSKIKSLLCDQECIKKRLCGHDQKCSRKCYESCDPCLEKLQHTLKCGHNQVFQCYNFKSEITTYICSEKCNKIRECGHNYPCLNLCSSKDQCTPCKEIVEVTLDCGHTFLKPCYINQKQTKCEKPCDKLRECGHNYPCLNLCSSKDQCTPCKETVEVTLDCGHTFLKPCNIDQKQIKCEKPCDKLRECGHNYSCLNLCSSKDQCTPCKETVEVTLDCGHTFLKPCYINQKQIKCEKPCDKLRECGHLVPCKMLCYENCSPCDQQVIKQLQCGHNISVECARFKLPQLQLCEQPCIKQRVCGHNYPCLNLCSSKDQCTSCKETVEVTLDCGHTLLKPCYLDQKQIKCEKPCDKLRECGHNYSCLNLCSSKDQCTPCKETVEVTLDCGHTFLKPCYIDQKQIKCEKPCDKLRECGHLVPCKMLCYENCSPCDQLVIKQLKCGHNISVECARFKLPQLQLCEQPCIKQRVCGHDFPCKNLCYEKCNPCEFLYQTKGECGHEILIKCHTADYDIKNYICHEKCIKQRDCDHDSPCYNECSQKCSPCQFLIEYQSRQGETFQIVCYEFQKQMEAYCGQQFN